LTDNKEYKLYQKWEIALNEKKKATIIAKETK
jgi:hypothetical protein